jgi:uncharacterized protein YkwD
MAAPASFLLVSACTTTTVLAPADQGASSDMTDSVLPLINALRAKMSLPALFHDAVAANAAKDQALTMARYSRMSHFLGPDPEFLDRMHSVDVTLPAAENIAVGQDSPERVMAAWTASKKHFKNMTGPYHGLGVAVARNTGGDDRPYWSMVLSSLPAPLAFGDG